MQTNRMTRYMAEKPGSVVGPVPPTAFVVLPAFFTVGASTQALAARDMMYRAAYEKAQRAAYVPSFHRRLFSVWN